MTRDGITVAWTGPKRRRRLRFEREVTGAWRRETATFRDGRWQTEGAELVDDVAVEVDRGARGVLDVIDEAWETIHQ